MTTSASIYQMSRPVEAPNLLAQAIQAEGLMQARRSGRMDDMKMDEYQRGIRNKNKLEEILGGQYANDAERESALIRGGFIDQAGALQKNRAEAAKSQSTLAKDKAEVVSKYLNVSKEIASRVMANPTPETATQALDFMENIGQQLGLDVSKDMQAQRQGLTQFTSPEQIKQWAAGHALQAEKLLPQFQRSDIGGQVQNLAINPLTAQASVTGTTQKTQSPDSAASVQATIRGQNMADARAREATSAAISKPFEVTGPDGNPMLVQQDKQGNITPVQGYKPKNVEKPLNDVQSKALLFGSRMKSADEVINALAKEGTNASIPGSRAGYGVGAVVNALSSAPQQQLDQAKRDFINAVLRRESGAVIADSEFANAEKQYFPQIGDSRQVIEQKARNRKLAIDGILYEVPEKSRNALRPTPQMPTADDVRKQADAILKGG